MNLYEKIQAVMKDVGYLTKDDSISFGNTRYKAISEEKVTSTVREKLIAYGLVILPIKQEHKREGTLSTVDVTYRIVNTEKPEEHIEVVSSGTGADTQDKGVGKAMTYAYKYMLLRTFAIPTGEDPDKISSAELDDKQEKAKAQEEKQQKSVEKPLVDELKIKLLRDLFDQRGIDEVQVLGKYGLKDIKEMNVSQFAYVVNHPDEVKASCSI